MEEILDMAASYAIIGVMIRYYQPSTAIAIMRKHDLCTTIIADAFMSRREFHAVILPDLPISDTISDLAWDIINDGYKMPIEDAVQVVRHSIVNLDFDKIK
tara:strand:- start:57 stop:359 length:303 start_codon:yes stop_codon:yes gene_type:complete